MTQRSQRKAYARGAVAYATKLPGEKVLNVPIFGSADSHGCDIWFALTRLDGKKDIDKPRAASIPSPT